MRTAIAIAIAALLGAACGSDRDDVVDAWNSAGLAPTELEPLDDEALGKDCTRGKVDGVEVVLCRYDTAALAEAAREPGLDRIGDTTGLALASDRLLLVVADRDGVDPSGRTINKVARAFADRPMAPAAKLAGN